MENTNWARKVKTFNDDALIISAKALVQKERELLTAVLWHFREIERRRLFSIFKCASLYDYATKVLAYPPDQAFRRVQAARLLEELPEIESKINSGELSLTHLCLASSHFKREDKSENHPKLDRKVKLSTIEKIENTSTREAEARLLEISNAPAPEICERVRVISKEQVEIKFSAPKELAAKIQKVKGMLAHKNPGITMADLVDKLCELAFMQWDPAKATTSEVRAKSAAPRVESIALKVTDRRNTVKTKSRLSKLEQPIQILKHSKYIARTTRRFVFQRAKGSCENCGSTYALQVEHKLPHAKGGSNAIENLKLLCRSCNQRAAIEQFGRAKMNTFLNKL